LGRSPPGPILSVRRTEAVLPQTEMLAMLTAVLPEPGSRHLKLAAPE
jgi:hypothetical protein